MEYQLGLWDALSAILVVRGSALGTVIFLVIYIVLPVLLYWKIPHRIFRGIIIVTYIFLWGVSLPPIWGSGWKINNEFLYMKAYGYSEDIKISSMEIGFVDQNGEWDTEYREMGANAPGLLSGCFRLENKKKALVFNHFYQNKRLLILADEKYYMIGHPGIEKLYDVLISQGAKEKIFK